MQQSATEPLTWLGVQAFQLGQLLYLHLLWQVTLTG